MELLILYAVLTIAFSFTCSLLEAILLSTPISFINSKEEDKDPRVARFKKLKENIDRPLSAILTINTLAHTLGATAVGAQATILFDSLTVGIISAVFTLLILVLSEIIPKTIGATYWRRMALSSVGILRFMIFVSYPFVILSELMTRFIAKNHNEATVSREEVSAMVEMAAEEGTFEASENKIIQNLMRLEKVNVNDIMTPEIVVSKASEEMNVAEFYKMKHFLQHSRIPVYADAEDEYITGYVLRQAVLEQVANDCFDTKLSEIKRDVIIVEENHSIMALWETLLAQKEHIAIVVGEYGSFEGIVTLEDIIESIFGLEIVDETDSEVDMQQYARTKWKERREKYSHIISKEEEKEEEVKQ